METITFKRTINAPAGKVWDVLWGDDTYPQWASAFSPSSQAKSDWQKGSEIRFTDAEGTGILAVIEDMVPNVFMSFRTIGLLGKGGVVDMESEESKAWGGSHENYELSETGGQTSLQVTLSSNGLTAEMTEMFKGMWPKALDKLQEIAEAG